MSWQCYELKFKAKSPIYIAYGAKLGIVNRTRYYIPGRTMWGAVTAILSRGIMGSYDSEIYRKIGEFVKNKLVFSYFYVKSGDILYPNYTEEGLKFGDMNKEKFEKDFISSYVSTAIDKTSRTAEEGSLHEFELISPVEFVGYLFTDLKENHGNTKYGVPIFVKEISDEKIKVEIEGKDIEIFEAIKKIQVGGERIYGFGKLELIREEIGQRNRLFGEYDLILDENRPRIKADIALSHVRGFEKLRNIKGDMEPLVWREWGKNGAGQDIKFGNVALVPGSRFDLAEMEIGDFGILCIP